MSDIVLTKDQEEALHTFNTFLHTDEKYMIIQGSAGCGKSTLIKYMQEAVHAKHSMYALLLQKNRKQEDFQFTLTATTNKAAAVLEEITDLPVLTIHSLLGLRVTPNFNTGKTKLTKNHTYRLLYNHLIIIDEFSMINEELLEIIDETCIDSKIILIGDEYQLAPVKQKESPVQHLDCTKVCLNKIVRNHGAIAKTGAQFRDTVETGLFKSITPHDSLLHTTGPEMQELVDKYFTDEAYTNTTVKILAWTNDRVMRYNSYIRELKGYPPLLQSGEYVQTNKPILSKRKPTIQTDTQLRITDIKSDTERMSIAGRLIELDRSYTGFLPNNHADMKGLLKYLSKNKMWKEYFEVKETWLDIRPTYASTVHKAQGSTYDTVFIDLDDIGRCTIATDVARMLYVAISRSRHQVYLNGTLPPRYQEVAA